MREAPELLAAHASPEFLQSLEPVRRLVAGDQTGIDRADRCADDPIRLDAGLVEGLIDPSLVGPERAATLEYEDDLPPPRHRVTAARSVFCCPLTGPRFQDIQHALLPICSRARSLDK